MAAFPAKYFGRCAAACGEGIAPGDQVVYVDDELVHVDCEGVFRPEPKPRPVCETCWLEKPCPCDDERRS